MLNAIAIDDEPKALEIIQAHVNKIPFIDLKESFRDAITAINWLQNNSIHLVFLDINMPHLSGLKFRELIGREAMIVFTTAYSEYAVESYNQNAVDYLLKPISFNRFFQAALKAQQLAGYNSLKNTTSQLTTNLNHSSGHNFIYIKSGTKKYQVNTGDILFLEKDKNYIYFHLPDKKIMSRMNMEQALNILPEGQFIQSHKSWIIALKHIEVIEPNQVVIKSVKIPIGKNYYKAVMALGTMK